MPGQPPGQPRVVPWTIGPVVVSRLYLSSKGPASTLSIPPHDLCVLLQMLGRTTLEQEGLTCRLHAGQWTVLDATQVNAHPHARDTQLLMLQIPRECLTEEIAAAATNPERGLYAYHNRALSRTLRIFTAMPRRFDAVTADQISTLLCRVVEHAIREQSCADRRAQYAASSAYARRLSRAYRYVKRHLDQSQLALGNIAKDAACTVRYLQKMFAPGGQSVREFILHSRLELVHCDLLSSRHSSRPVTEIALAHGFNNASHFTRKYRRHFGITPSSVRFVYQTSRLQFSTV